MTDRERTLLVNALRADAAKTVSRAEAVALLVSLGVSTEDGRLTPAFGGEGADPGS